VKTLFAYLIFAGLLMPRSPAQAILHVRGHITDATTHMTVAGVSVGAIIARHSAMTDVNGFFSLELRDEVKPGDAVTIHIEKLGYHAIDVTVAASEAVPYPIQISSLKASPSTNPKEQTTQQTPATETVQPRDSFPLPTPMFTEASDRFNISAGGMSTTLTNGKSSCLVGVVSTCLVKGYVEANKFVVDAELYVGPGHGDVRLTKNELHKDVPEWDRCFDATTLEIVDDRLTPVFQMTYTTPNDIVIYGILRLGPTAYVFSPNGFNSQAITEPVTEDQYPVKRIFKYPSRTYQCKELEAPTSGVEPAATGPYSDFTNARLCKMTLTESARIYKMADDCLQALTRSAKNQESDEPRNDIRRAFSKQFMTCCAQMVRDIDRELLLRLKPVVIGEDDRLLHEMEFESKHNPTGVVLSTVEDISLNERNLCAQLMKSK